MEIHHASICTRVDSDRAIDHSSVASGCSRHRRRRSRRRGGRITRWRDVASQRRCLSPVIAVHQSTLVTSEPDPALGKSTFGWTAAVCKPSLCRPAAFAKSTVCRPATIVSVSNTSLRRPEAVDPGSRSSFSWSTSVDSVGDSARDRQSSSGPTVNTSGADAEPAAWPDSGCGTATGAHSGDGPAPRLDAGPASLDTTGSWRAAWLRDRKPAGTRDGRASQSIAFLARIGNTG